MAAVGTRVGAEVMAQEASHSEGLMWHAETPPEPAPPPFPYFNPSWPWYHTSIGHVGMWTADATPHIIPPTWTDGDGHAGHTHDFMSYTGGFEWASPYTYCVLLDEMTNGDDRCSDAVKTMPASRWVDDAGSRGPSGVGALELAVGPGSTGSRSAGAAANPAAADEQSFMSVSGEIAWDGKSATLAPIETIRRVGILPFLATGDAFVVQVLTADDKVLFQAPFTPQGTHLTTGSPRPFSFVVPRYDGTAAVAIWRGKHLIALSSASKHAPQVTLTTPLAGTTLSGPTPVTWDASDADGDTLSYAVELSPNGGASWLPVAVGLSEPTLTLDPATLPGTQQALLRVEASDGFDSTAAVTEATFSIPAGAPQVSISAPVADQTVAAGTSVSFEASAIDMTDGALPDTAYRLVVGRRR